MKKKFVIGGIIIILAIAFLGYRGFESSATYYYTVSELAAQEDSIYGQNIRVDGIVIPGSIEQDSGELKLRFSISGSGTDLPVVYQGIVPDTFKPDIEVVAEGHLNPDGIFQAHTLMTKCPSRYVPAK